MKRLFVKALPLLFVLAGSAGAVRAAEPDTDPLAGRKAFEEIEVEGWSEAETARCFTAAEIDDATFARMQGRSYKADCTIPRGELRYLRVLHCDFDGRVRIGEMVCHREVAADLLAIFRALYAARYPIARMVLIDDYEADDRRSMEANNTSGFNYREIRRTGKLSNHSYGYAVDINPLYNPCVIRRNGRTSVDPEAGRPYADRQRAFRGKIDRSDLCYREFIKRGFIWGGDWNSLKDYQHFEKPRRQP